MKSDGLSGLLDRLMTGLRGMIQRGLLGKSGTAYTKQFGGNDLYWDRALASQAGWPVKEVPKSKSGPPADDRGGIGLRQSQGVSLLSEGVKMSNANTNATAAKSLEPEACACGHAVDSHTHPSKMVRDANTGEVVERFAHGRCTVTGCACSEFEEMKATLIKAPPAQAK